MSTWPTAGATDALRQLSGEVNDCQQPVGLYSRQLRQSVANCTRVGGVLGVYEVPSDAPKHQRTFTAYYRRGKLRCMACSIQPMHAAAVFAMRCLKLRVTFASRSLSRGAKIETVHRT